MPTRLPTPPGSPPPLVLCADGGGSKVCVVIRSADGLEVRGTAGPCNVLSVGHANAIKAILLATYRALSQLPPSHLHPDLIIPPLDHTSPSGTTNGNGNGNGHTHSTPSSPLVHPVAAKLSHLAQQKKELASPYASRPGSPVRTRLPPINVALFQYVWLGLAGISTPADSKAFLPLVMRDLCVSEARVKISNDVNLLAAPALDLPGVEHVAAVVCGTGTVGRTIRVDKMPSAASSPGLEGVDGSAPPPQGAKKVRQLPLEDVAVARGWGYLLCDEGSAFWLGRLAIRSILFYADRLASTSIHSTSKPCRLPLHDDLLAYFGCEGPMGVIDVTSLSGPYVADLSVGEAVAKRNALMAGAAKVVFKYAFPEDDGVSPPSPPISLDGRSDSAGQPGDLDPMQESRKEALRLAKKSVEPMVELTTELLGDRTVVDPRRSALSLGGGLWNSNGYRKLFLDSLKRDGIDFKEVLVVGDPGGEGAKGLSRVEFD